MRDALHAIADWKAAGHRYALAIVTHTWGSSPRPVGSTMAIRGDGLVVGSVSGGCVEGAVLTEALEAIQSGKAKNLEFGSIPDEAFWAVGLSCGGEIRVMVLPDAVMGADVWDPVLTSHTSGDSWSVAIHQEGAEELVLRHVQPEKLIIIGAVHIAISLIKFAKELGFHTILIDPRAALTDLARFPVPPDEMIVSWPQQALAAMELGPDSYAAILSHDPKIDDVSLEILLKSDVKYIGALGGRITQAKRKTQLEEAGFSPSDIARVHGPIGLAIGALSPEEIALSIMAEIVKVRRGKN